MARMPRAYESKTYEEWRDESWEGAIPAVRDLVETMRALGVPYCRVGKPYDLEIDLRGESLLAPASKRK